MKSTLAFMVAALLIGGCKSEVVEVDRTPPFAPRGIATQTGDGVVTVSWFRNSEPDVASYKVYVNDTYNGTYTLIGQTTGLSFDDDNALNGVTWYYAVSAVDEAGNESELSTDVAYDTPRPEGTGVFLPDFHADPTHGGYDFSTYSIGPYDDQFTDLFYEFLGGMYYFNVWDDTEIQDMGYTETFPEIGYAPTAGWSPTHDVRIIPGHTYVIRTWDNHYAKVRVRSLTISSVGFDWAYQLQQNNTRLKAGGTRGTLRAGSGFLSRNDQATH